VRNFRIVAEFLGRALVAYYTLLHDVDTRAERQRHHEVLLNQQYGYAGFVDGADLVADLKVEQVIKIAKMKGDGLSGTDMFAKVKEIMGTCTSMGVMVEGKRAVESIQDVNAGKYDEAIKAERTELTAEALKELEERKKALQQEIEQRRAEFTATAKQIIEANAGQARATIKAKLVEAKVPTQLIEELLPADTAAKAEPAPAAKK